MKNTLRFVVSTAMVVSLGLASARPANAGLALTPAGIAAGFTLSNYASDGGPGSYRYLAAAPLSDGKLAVVDYNAGQLVKYADVDGQNLGTQLASVALNSVVNIVRLNGTTYASQLGGGLFSVDASLALTSVNVGGFSFGYGLAANQVNGMIYAASGNGIFVVDPVGNTFSQISGSAGRFFDGVSVSPDGKTVYGATGDNVLGYSVATGAQVFSFATGGRGPDGTGVIAGGLYNGYVIINNNDGTIELVDPTGTNSTIIASGGTRGDFTSPDANDGSLLLSQYGDMWRLKAPQGSFTSTPEPSTILSAGVAAAGMIVVQLRRRRKSA